MENSLHVHQRKKWFDSSKGIAISFIVFHHVMSGGANSLDFPSWFITFYRIIEPIAMPLFFFISGIFFINSINLSFKDFFKKKALYFLYFYIIWNTLSVILRATLSKFANKPVEFYEALELFWEPTFVMWFLYAMFWVVLVSYFLRKLHPLLHVSLIIIVVALSKAIFSDMPFIINHTLNYLPFFTIGLCFSSYWKDIVVSKIFNQQLVVTLAIVVLVTVLVSSGFVDRKASNLYYPVAMITNLLIISICFLIRNSRTADFFAYLGERSLYIYLLHSVPAAGFRILGVKLGFEDIPHIIVLVSFFITMLLCVIVYEITKNIRFLQWIYQTPRFIK